VGGRVISLVEDGCRKVDSTVTWDVVAGTAWNLHDKEGGDGEGASAAIVRWQLSVVGAAPVHRLGWHSGRSSVARQG
jgi:hypothetical protein